MAPDHFGMEEDESAESEPAPTPAKPDAPRADESAAPPPPAAKPPAPGPGGDRPSWLVGADEALDAESTGQEQPERPHVPIPPPRGAAPPIKNPYANMARQGDDFALGSSWREMGYAVEVSRTTPAAAAEAPPPDDAAAPPTPEVEAATEPAQPKALDDDFAGPETPRAKPARIVPPPKPPTLWERAGALATTPGGIIVMVAALVILIGIRLIVHAKVDGTPVAWIHHHGADFDGRKVRVHGKVGEVYPFGGGYAFYLLQGRDTLVIFTRTRTPVTDQIVTVDGVISTGFLDGVSRQALFEGTAP